MKQSHDAGGDAGVLAQRRPHVILRIGHADLAQEARHGADERDIAPGEPGREHERVIAVILGVAPHHREETGLQLLLARVEVDGLARCAFERHVVKPDLGRVMRLDVVGALVDHAEAHVLQNRHAFGERDRPFMAEDLEPGACWQLAERRGRVRRRADAPA